MRDRCTRAENLLRMGGAMLLRRDAASICGERPGEGHGSEFDDLRHVWISLRRASQRTMIRVSTTTTSLLRRPHSARGGRITTLRSGSPCRWR